jgi:hypothetical protein
MGEEMRNPVLEFEAEIICSKCGDTLEVDSSTSDFKGTARIEIRPCDKCLEESRDEGDKVGYDRGLKDGESEGTQ